MLEGGGVTESFAWTDLEVRRALGLPLGTANDQPTYSGISTDSRTVQPGGLYVALLGERFDGHDFVEAAFAAGAGGAVVSASAAEAGVGHRKGPAPGPLYAVPDTLVALGHLATHRRTALPARVVGITGSSGKTGTKDLAAAALSSTLRVYASRGNLNNRVGVPLTLLSAPEDAQVVVAEMGTNEPGEIATLAGIALPEIGVVTTVGEGHLEGLGTVEGVLREKLSLLEGLKGERHGVVGDTPPELPEAARHILPKVRVAGWSERAEPALRPVDPVRGEGGGYSFTWKGERVTLTLPGKHAVTNALLALAVAERLGVEPAAAARGIATARPGWMRGEVRRVGGLTLLLDCYNANPQSVLASLAVLEEWGAKRRVALLGSMLELGAQSETLHREVLADALGRRIDLLVASGKFALAAAGSPARTGTPTLLAAEQPADAYALLRENLAGDEVVLLKGSRGVALERLIPSFEADFGAEGAG
jgi:UDP-N-acetylmuramoyl-tripeptide--D-alanyl-D-alanine ligase